MACSTAARHATGFAAAAADADMTRSRCAARPFLRLLLRSAEFTEESEWPETTRVARRAVGAPVKHERRATSDAVRADAVYGSTTQ